MAMPNLIKKSIHFMGCIREIRNAVFGRDNRKPIADAIVELHDSGANVRHLTSVDTEVYDKDPTLTDYYYLVLHYSGEPT